MRTLAVALALVLPLLPVAIWSVARGWRFPALWPPEVSLGPWAASLDPGGPVLAAFGTSMMIAAAVTLLALLLGLPAAQVLARGRAGLQAALLVPLALPPVALALGLHPVFLRLGLANGPAGVVLSHLVPALPYTILLLAGSLAQVDPRLGAQARSLGARPWQVLWHVTLPAIRPGLLVAGGLTFLVSWGQYALTFLIGGGRVQTLPLLLYASAGAGRPDLAAVTGILALVPGLLMLGFGLLRRAPLPPGPAA